VTKRDRKSALALNTFLNLISWFSPIILAFIATPIIVNGLGTSNYGLYAIILGFASYSFSLGIGKVGAKFISELRITGETSKINDAVSATFWLSSIIGIAGTAILAASAPYIVSNVLLISEDSRDTAILALYITCGTILATIISQVFQFVLHGLHKFGENLILTNLSGILLNLGNIILVLNGHGIAALLAWSFSVTTFIGLMFFARAKALLPSLRIRLRIPLEMLALVLKYGSSMIFYQVFANVLFIFERAWVMRKFGAEALAFYSIPMLLVTYLHGFVGSFAAVLFPVMNELLIDVGKQIELYHKTTKIVLAVVVFAVVTFICTGRIGLALWLDEEFAANSYSLLVIHSLTFGLISMFTIVWQTSETYRLAGLNVMTTVIWGVIAIPLMIAAAGSFGPEGIAIARLAAVCVSLPMIFYVEKRCFGHVFGKFWVAVVFRVTIAGATAALMQTLILNSFAPGWLVLAATGLGGGVVYAAVLLLAGYLTRDERKILVELFAKRSVTTEIPPSSS